MHHQLRTTHTNLLEFLQFLVVEDFEGIYLFTKKHKLLSRFHLVGILKLSPKRNNHGIINHKQKSRTTKRGAKESGWMAPKSQFEVPNYFGSRNNWKIHQVRRRADFRHREAARCYSGCRFVSGAIYYLCVLRWSQNATTEKLYPTRKYALTDLFVFRIRSSKVAEHVLVGNDVEEGYYFMIIITSLK